MAKPKGEKKSKTARGPSDDTPAPGAPSAPAAPPGEPKRRGPKKGAAAAAKQRRPRTVAARSAGAPLVTEPEDRDESDEEDRDESEQAEGEEQADASDPDAEVVEVVGEIVDETPFEGDDLPAAARARTSSPPVSSSFSGRNEAALSRTDPLQAYLREVQRHPLLTPEEERDLTQHYVKTQDVVTARRLVTANLRLVVKLAYEYRRAYKNILDLIQEGNIGLMQAVRRYDPYRGVKLSSYAAWWIRAYILRFILNNWRLVKLGTTQAQRKLFFNLNKEKAKLSALGIEPSAAEIARRLNVEEKEVVDMDRRLSSGEASLDAPVGDSDGRAVTRLEMLPSATTGPDTAFEASEMGQMVQERLGRFRETLKAKDAIIFDKRLVADEPLTLQELGDEFGISRERVRQLEARLTLKLRAYLQQELGDAVPPG